MSKLIAFKLTDKEVELLGNPDSLKIKESILGKISYHTSNDVYSMLSSLNHQLSEINQRLTKLEGGVPAPKVESVPILAGLKKICANCGEMKSLNGGLKDNSGRWNCEDCVKKLTPPEQTL